MKKKMIAILLSAVLATGCFSACGTAKETASTAAATAEEQVKTEAEAVEEQAKTETTEEVAKAESEAAEELTKAEEEVAEEVTEAKSEVTEELTEAKSEAAEEPAKAEEEAAEEQAEAKSEAAEAQAETEAAEEQSKEEAEAADEIIEAIPVSKDAKPLEMVSPFSLGELTGGLKPMEEIPEPVDLTEEQQAQMDRAMRAYKRSSDSLLKNKAKSYYYYSQMTKDEQAVYDAMMMVCDDPVNPDNITRAVISVDPYSYDFSDLYTRAFYGMLYDHAELFWLYNFIECDMCVYVPYENTAPAGKYEVYFCLDKMYDNYETEVKKFNKAVKKFLEEIDTSKSDQDIVKQVHNKLVNLVTYNTPVAEDNTYWGYCNFAHTAYGAMVADSDGNKNYAVCDGYSQAFVYLLQQCGLNAAVIVGIAGPASYSAGGHAWSVVQLDGDWYEIDSTWDDPGSVEDLVEEIKSIDTTAYTYFREAIDDKEYKKKLRYYLYNVTTDAISWFEPDDYYYYDTKDGQYSFCLLNSSVHIRASEDTWGYEDFGLLMELAPIATGTKYAMR